MDVDDEGKFFDDKKVRKDNSVIKNLMFYFFIWYRFMRLNIAVLINDFLMN